MSKKVEPDRLDGYTPEEIPDTDPAQDSEFKRAAREWAEKLGYRYDNLDGFVNELTGVGDLNQDKTLGGGLYAGGILPIALRYMSGADMRDRWRGTDLGARVVEQVPSEMTRQGFEVSVQPTEDDHFKLAPKVQMRTDQLRRLRRDEAAPIVAAREQRNRPTAGPVAEQDDQGQAITEALEAKLRDLGAYDKLREALNYQRCYGGGGILLGIDDGKDDLTLPLDEQNIKSFKHLTVFRGGWDGELIAWTYYRDSTKPRYGEPEIYMLRNLGVPIARIPAPGSTETQPILPMADLNAPGAPLTRWIHESRLIIFPGQAADRFARVQMRGWGDSVFMRIDEVLAQYNQTWNSISILMQEFAQGILKIDGLARMLSKVDPATGGSPSSGTTGIAARAKALQMSMSVARVRMLDTTEDFTRATVPLGGLAEVLREFALRMAAAADMPVALLFGQSPGGLRAGDDDTRFFYDRVKSKQQSDLMPQLRRIVRLMQLAKDGPTGGVEPTRWDVTARPLWQPTDKEDADLRKTQAETDQIYYNIGVVSSEEIAASRFAGSKYSTETTLDFDGRQRMAQAALEAAPEGAPQQLGQGNPDDATAGEGVDLTATSMSAIITVNEARASKGLPPWPGADGELTVAEFTAKRAKVIAEAANAEQGKVGAPPDADKPAPAPAAPFGKKPPTAPAPGEEEPEAAPFRQGGRGELGGRGSPPRQGR